MVEAPDFTRGKSESTQVELLRHLEALEPEAKSPDFPVNTQGYPPDPPALQPQASTILSQPSKTLASSKTPVAGFRILDLPSELVREIVKSAIRTQSYHSSSKVENDCFAACTLAQVSRGMCKEVLTVLKPAVACDEACKEEVRENRGAKIYCYDFLHAFQAISNDNRDTHAALMLVAAVCDAMTKEGKATVFPLTQDHDRLVGCLRYHQHMEVLRIKLVMREQKAARLAKAAATGTGTHAMDRVMAHLEKVVVTR